MVIPSGEFDYLCFIRSVGRYYPPSEVSSWLVGGKLVRGMNHLDHLYDCILNNRIDDNISMFTVQWIVGSHLILGAKHFYLHEWHK